eukprot:CAMPEP_0116079300 /NCGR_PEP_ID=MMETSP0327-20121206/1068_1 /TAXON_ID=44447 /ORGANISM="Pseudo-nitzschia delicatissima, Strain B596" /LENGTH=578 /DNA_ID=CAMNT_0003569915 /DNA_START=260 /DNA_END=1997 /DNA_ORIENTATION=-
MTSIGFVVLTPILPHLIMRFPLPYNGCKISHIYAVLDLVAPSFHSTIAESEGAEYYDKQELDSTNGNRRFSQPHGVGSHELLSHPFSSSKKIILRDMISLKFLPEEIGDLARLEEMDLGISAIGSLPPSIGRLQNLKYLDLSNTSYLSNLPEEIGDLSSLKRLDLTKSSITTLPPSIGRLKNLDILLCSTQGYLTSLPEEIGNLASLKILDFATITIDAHRENFIVKNGRLLRIQELNLGYTQDLSKLSDIEEGFDGGTIMDLLRRPSITSLPPSVGRLQNLEVLCLGSTKNLLNLPQEVGDISSLKSLDLSGTGIVSLPPSIGRLHNLEVLLLPNTKRLSNLPGEIGNLCSLKCLDLGGSTIASLPPSIGRLENLEILRLPHTNNLPSLPKEIVNFNKLKQVSRVGIDSSISSIPLFSASRKSLRRFDFIESNRCKSPLLEETLRGIGTNQWEFLLKQTQNFQFLGYLGWAIKLERLESSGVSNSNVPLVGKLFYTLACNRARARTRFGTTEGKSMQPIPKLWPHLFHSPRRAFENDEFVTEADAIYQLLIDGREHFVATIMNRKTNGGVSEIEKDA